MSSFFSKILALSRGEKRTSSEEFEAAVNAALLSDTVNDATRKPYISEEGSLNLSAVWACVRILSETVGTLPVHLYRKTDSGREQVKSHPCSLILSRPNSYTSRFALLHHLMVSCTLWGNGDVRIYRDRNFRPVRLQLLHPTQVEPMLTGDDELFYRTDNGELLPSYEMLHLRGLSTNGYKGKSRKITSMIKFKQEYYPDVIVTTPEECTACTGAYGAPLGGADVVIEVAGAEDSFQLAWQSARPNAIVTVVALYDRPQILPLPDMYGKNLTFKTGGVDGCDCAEILSLIEQGKIDTTTLITHHFTLCDIEQAYSVFENKMDGVIKIAIHPDDVCFC